MMTPVQCRMARAALGWGVRDLAAKAKVGVSTVTRFEAGRGCIAATITVMRGAFEDAGIRFPDATCVCAPERPAERAAA